MRHIDPLTSTQNMTIPLSVESSLVTLCGGSSIKSTVESDGTFESKQKQVVHVLNT